MTKQELIEKRARLLNEADEILKKAKDEGRYDLTADENTRWDAIHADADKMKAFIDKCDKQESNADGNGRRTDPNPTEQRGNGNHGGAGRVSAEDRRDALRGWFLAGSVDGVPEPIRQAATRAGVNVESKYLHLSLPEHALRADSYGPNGGLVPSQRSIEEWEKRAQAVGSGAAGGFTVPDEAMRALEISLLAFGGMRQVATVIRSGSGAALPIPTVNDTANVGEILGENTTVNNQDLVFAQIVLDAYKYSSKQILVSVEFLQDSSIAVAETIGRLLGERIGRITNNHFTTGTGSSQPNGLVTASGAGVTGVADPPTYDNFVDLLHSVDPAYRNNARFMMNDTTLKTVKKIKVLQYSGDTTGAPLWAPGLATGQPDTILGFPYVINQSMASPGSSAKKILFGDLSKYLIRDVRDIMIMRLDERYAELGQVGFLAFSRHDGDLLDAGTDPVKHMAQA
jgi:HK97 family phage major capsid protein